MPDIRVTVERNGHALWYRWRYMIGDSGWVTVHTRRAAVREAMQIAVALNAMSQATLAHYTIRDLGS